MNKIVKLTVVLFLICAIVSAVLGAVNEVTKGPIETQQREKTLRGRVYRGRPGRICCVQGHDR